MTSRQLLKIIPVRFLARPFELLFPIACFIAGLPSLFGAPRPNSISATMPKWASLIWGLSLTLGGLLASVGIIKIGLFKSYVLERLGFRLLGSALTVYSIAIVLTVGLRGLVSAATSLAFGLASLAHVYWLGVLLNAGDRRRG